MMWRGPWEMTGRTVLRRFHGLRDSQDLIIAVVAAEMLITRVTDMLLGVVAHLRVEEKNGGLGLNTVRALY